MSRKNSRCWRPWSRRARSDTSVMSSAVRGREGGGMGGGGEKKLRERSYYDK